MPKGCTGEVTRGGVPMSFDKPYKHVGTKAKVATQEAGITIDRQIHISVNIPPLSGCDFNKVIEHAHARLKWATKHWFAKQDGRKVYNKGSREVLQEKLVYLSRGNLSISH